MKTYAFFDMDDTLLKGDLPQWVVWYGLRKKVIGVFFLIKAVYYFFLHKISVLDFESILDEILKPVKGFKVKDMEKEYDVFFEKNVKRKLFDKMVRVVEDHQAKGHVTVLLTNSPKILSKKIKELLKIDHNISSELEVKDGKFTGKFKQICYREYKTKAFVKFVKEHNVDVKTSYFYTDSYNDKGVLDLVGHPVAVRPDIRLRMYARKKGWKVIR